MSLPSHIAVAHFPSYYCLSSLPPSLAIPPHTAFSFLLSYRSSRCPLPRPPVMVTAALGSSSKKIAAAALVGHDHCLFPSLPAASSPRPPATSSYASSLRPAATAKPSSDAPAPATSQPLSSSSIAAKALTDAVVVLLLYLLYLFFPLSQPPLPCRNLLLDRASSTTEATFVPPLCSSRHHCLLPYRYSPRCRSRF
ncbi:hypothetical protein BHE74_00009035 [Ensete ventricosum]|nr:hypothetical protein BHE74_00009035 [Ensete ventricosum]RZR89009.1 hypothetical protein BHM03_00016662 [Ensete ventricosum]